MKGVMLSKRSQVIIVMLILLIIIIGEIPRNEGSLPGTSPGGVPLPARVR